MSDLQNIVWEWCKSTLGPAAASHRQERALRLLEEALELAQAESLGMPIVIQLMLRVWSRPVGEVHQEVAGIGVTTLAYCAAAGLDFERELEIELERIRRPEVQESIRKKQHEKREAGVSAIKDQ